MACCGPCQSAWGNTAPALTVSQGRTVLAVIVPLRTETVADALELVAWVQRCPHRASLSHRRRREAEGESERAHAWRLRAYFLESPGIALLLSTVCIEGAWPREPEAGFWRAPRSRSHALPGVDPTPAP